MSSQNVFSAQLAKYKKLIDKDINDYCAQVNKNTLQNYGQHSQIVSNAYADILKRGGKRIRGALTIVGYEMCGGKDKQMIVQAARAIEMMHTYMLVIDDIQDRAFKRRNGPSAHKLLEAEHLEQNWKSDGEHTGISLALNAALLGSHGAQLVISNLEVSEELRIKAMNIMNHTMVVTAHGQTNDIINEIDGEVSEDSIEKVMQWKTAHYSFLNPIHMGMVLAGAPCEDTNAITEYALNMGKAFQISDDLLVVAAGDDGKNPINDIREGKQTLLTYYALQNASNEDVKFLHNCLGNFNLSAEDFKRCQSILKKSGAPEFAQGIAKHYIATGLKALNLHSSRWNKSSVRFLEGMADYLLARVS